MKVRIPSYTEVIAYYLREDVSHLLWVLSNQRRLTFFFHSDVDLSRGDADSHRTPHGIRIHCLKDAAELRARIGNAAAGQENHLPGFTPFLGMGNVANRPGQPDDIIGWDMRFEFDLDRLSSFRAVIPAMAVLEHFSVPYLAKYSGHRSMHLVIPAEAFPAHMQRQANHKHWMDAFQTLGDLLCLFSPHMDRGSIRTSKEMVLTAPYSLHRYYGLLSIPLTLQGAMTFDPATATLETFADIDWHPDQFVDRDDHMAPLLHLAENRLGRSGGIIGLARSVFSGQTWRNFTGHGLAERIEDPTIASLVAGLPSVNSQLAVTLTPQQAERLDAARLVMDSPAAKETKFYRLIGEVGYGVADATLAAVRLTLARTLGRWVDDGLDGTIDHLKAVAADTDIANPVSAAVRMLSLLPDDDAHKAAALTRAWEETGTATDVVTAFLALSCGELSSQHTTPLFLHRTEAPEQLLDMVSRSSWITERRPDLAVATLCIAFGLERVARWRDANDDPVGRALVDSVFGGPDKDDTSQKFQFAAERVFNKLGEAHLADTGSI